jgi:nitrite reductase/ring-hydroxylating ferredoxin subunit
MTLQIPTVQSAMSLLTRKPEYRVGRETDLGPRTVTGAGPYAVVNVNGEYLAVDRFCRHLGADLADGAVTKDGCLVCPWHGAKYDLRTGRMVRGPQGIFARMPRLDATFKKLTTVLPLRRGTVVRRDGEVFVR